MCVYRGQISGFSCCSPVGMLSFLGSTCWLLWDCPMLRSGWQGPRASVRVLLHRHQSQVGLVAVGGRCSGHGLLSSFVLKVRRFRFSYLVALFIWGDLGRSKNSAPAVFPDCPLSDLPSQSEDWVASAVALMGSDKVWPEVREWEEGDSERHTGKEESRGLCECVLGRQEE